MMIKYASPISIARFTQQERTVGKYKVDVARERILEINPDAVVNIHKTFYVPETADSFVFPSMIM